MASFKGPKGFTAGKQPAAANKDKIQASEFGIDSDDAGSGTGSESEHDEGNTSSSNNAGGFDVQTVLTLQKSLRVLVNDKNELSDKLRAALDRAIDAENKARIATEQSNVKVNMFTVAQRRELDALKNTIDGLKLSLQEVEKNGEAEQGPRRLADVIQELTNEHRSAIEQAAQSEAECKRVSEEAKSLEFRVNKQLEEMTRELQAARASHDPVAAARFAQHAPVDSAELDALRKEAETLRSQLRDAEYNAAHPSQAARSTGDSDKSSELAAKNRDLSAQVRDLQAEIARFRSMTASGSEKEQVQQAAHDKLMADLSELRSKSSKLENTVEDLQRRLREEQDARKIAETQTNDIKQSMQAQLQGTASAGEDAKARLQSLAQELASEKASLKAEASAHANTKKELEAARANLEKVKGEAAQLSNDSANSLQKEKERAAAAVQAAKADAAAKVAEIEQRSKDNMRDLKEKLANFSSQVQPMVELVKFLSKNYRTLSKQARDLQGEIAPTMKQYKRDLLRTLSEVDTQYKEMIVKYKKEMTLRKKLHNELVDLKGAIRVFCRVRPQIKEDSNGPEGKFVTRFDSNDDQLIIIRNKDKDAMYEMDKVFTPESKQEDVFEAARDLVVSVIDGYNVCIFAYGQTGSGKTFTMEGTDENPGLNRRSLKELFSVVEEKKADWSFEIEISILEIYNETISDLLGEDRKAKLEVHQATKGGNYVKGLSRHVVRSPEEVRAKFKESQKHRRVATTQMNDLSSRSHALLVVYVTGTNLSTGVQTRGKLNLIDLAGSERIAKSGAIDDDVRLKEAAAINTSLSALGTVINALATKAKHVPYRDSKLTYLLQDSLGGAAKTLMVVQVAPVLKNVGESVCSLNFAARVRAVELGSAKKQAESSEVAQLKKRIAELEKGA